MLGAWLALGAISLVPVAWGADPQTYKVRLEGKVAKDIENTMSASSDLVTLRKSAPVSPVGLILRARGDTVRLKQVLESFGYYQSAVTATIDGDPLISADLADKLAALPAKTDAAVVLSFTPGPLYHLGKVSLTGDLPDSMHDLLKLHRGQPAIAADVLNAGTRLVTALQDRGYAFAKVDDPEVYELPDLRELEVTFHVQTGAVARFGAISVTGLERTHLSSVLSRLHLRAGEPYSAQALDRARANLLSMGVFGSVVVKIADTADANGNVPVTFRVTERKRHEVNLSAGYSSDLGGRAGVSWTDRNLLGSAEELILSASVINLNGSATNGLGYDTSAKVIVPAFLQSDQTLQIALEAIKQSLIAYDQTAETAGLTLTRNLTKIWTASVGVTTTQETINQPEDRSFFSPPRDTFYYTLFALPLTLRYDSTGLVSPLPDPTHGMRVAVTVTPTLSLGPPDATFVISQIRASGYLDLDKLFATGAGRSVVAVRGVYGYAQGVANIIGLPPDQRFYAGGSETVRGYRFQSVGPQFSGAVTPANVPQGEPEGGVAVQAASVELRQRIGRNYGFAAFLDGGRVYGGRPAQPAGAVSPTEPLANKYQFGAGAGLRYYTPIGALRLDIAVPLESSTERKARNDDRLEVYIGLGQAF